MKKLSIALLVLLISVFMSCKDSASSSSSAADDAGVSIGVTDTAVKIGSFGPLTGPAALWGNIMKGMDAYFKMINEEGGINGRKIEFVMKDDAYDPSRTVPAVREIVQRDEVFAFVGGIGTAPCMSVMDYLVEENIPWISPISGGTHWSIPQKKSVFSVLPYYIDEAIIQVRHAVTNMDSKKIGIIYQNDDVGKSALVGAKSELSKHGLSFVSEVPVEITDTDLSSHVAKLKDSGAETVLLWTLPRQGVITVTNAKVINYQPQWIASFILSDMTLMHQLTKGAWEGVTFGSFATPPYDIEEASISKYKAAMAKAYPDVRWGTFPYAGFLYAQPFVEALKNIEGKPTREKLIASMEKLDMDIEGLRLSFSPTKRQGVRSMQLLKCTGADTYEEVSEYMNSDSDILALVKELEAH